MTNGLHDILLFKGPGAASLTTDHRPQVSRG